MRWDIVGHLVNTFNIAHIDAQADIERENFPNNCHQIVVIVCNHGWSPGNGDVVTFATTLAMGASTRTFVLGVCVAVVGQLANRNGAVGGGLLVNLKRAWGRVYHMFAV